jgi:hypothetical protein
MQPPILGIGTIDISFHIKRNKCIQGRENEVRIVHISYDGGGFGSRNYAYNKKIEGKGCGAYAGFGGYVGEGSD